MAASGFAMLHEAERGVLYRRARSATPLDLMCIIE
jgi:hypothetical protein